MAWLTWLDFTWSLHVTVKLICIYQHCILIYNSSYSIINEVNYKKVWHLHTIQIYALFLEYYLHSLLLVSNSPTLITYIPFSWITKGFYCYSFQHRYGLYRGYTNSLYLPIHTLSNLAQRFSIMMYMYCYMYVQEISKSWVQSCFYKQVL